jgi:hypothetical protein
VTTFRDTARKREPRTRVCTFLAMFLSAGCPTVGAVAVEEYRRTYRSGLSRFDEQRDPVDHRLDPVLPAEFGLVHAVQVGRVDLGLQEPDFLTSPLAYKTALCGAVVKVELPMEFDPGDEDSCPRCVGPALRNQRTPLRHREEPPAAAIVDRFRKLPALDPQGVRDDVDAAVDQRLPGVEEREA